MRIVIVLASALLSGAALAVSALMSGWAALSAGDSSIALDSIGLPSYQHFLPSIMRQDQ